MARSDAASEGCIKILVIEDQTIVHGLVRRVIAEAFDKADLAVARDGRSGLELCRALKPDLVLLDLELPDSDGFDLVVRIRSAAPSTRILVLSGHAEAYILHRVREAGVDGFFDKNDQQPEMLAEAFRKVSSGGRYFSPAIESAIARYNAASNAFQKILSEREQELLRLFGRGLSDARIAEMTGIREFTVRNHRHSIMVKLDIHSTPELIRYALENGFSRVRSGSRGD